jgi:hypothetical protein
VKFSVAPLCICVSLAGAIREGFPDLFQRCGVETSILVVSLTIQLLLRCKGSHQEVEKKKDSTYCKNTKWQWPRQHLWNERLSVALQLT